VLLVVLLVSSAAGAAAIRGHTEIPNIAALRARSPVALAFFDRRRGVMATAGGALLATTNGGESWRVRSRLAATNIVTVSSAVGFATTKRALLRTNDGGRHWRVIAHVAGIPSFADPLHGWIYGRQTLATEDGGRTWRRLLLLCGRDLDPRQRAVSRVSATVGFAACASQPSAGQQLKRLYVTRDGGRTWKLRANDHQVPSSGYLASIAFADDRKGLMTTNRGGLLATGDGGRSWRMLLLTDDVTDVVAVQRLGRGALVVSLLNGAILRSSDAGKHWTGVYPHSLPQPEEISFSTPRDGIGVGRSDWTYSHPAMVATHDGGRTWKFLSAIRPDAAVDSLVRVSDRILYGVGSTDRRAGQILFRSTDGGRTWTRLRAPARSQFFKVSFMSPAVGVLGDDAGRFYSTGDGGRTWRLVHGIGRDLRMFVFLTRLHGLAISDEPGNETLYETTDGARTWHVYERAPARRPLGLAALVPNHIWIVDMPTCGQTVTRRQPSCPGAILRTSDGGRIWQRIELNMVPGSGSLDFVSPSVGYIASLPAPYTTTNGGRDWRLVR
jgi:photosystem II stability/assembly factor-like uncharacterized protein